MNEKSNIAPIGSVWLRKSDAEGAGYKTIVIHDHTDIGHYDYTTISDGNRRSPLIHRISPDTLRSQYELRPELNKAEQEKFDNWVHKIQLGAFKAKDIEFIGKPTQNYDGEWCQEFKVDGIHWGYSAIFAGKRGEPVPNIATRKKMAIDCIESWHRSQDMSVEYVGSFLNTDKQQPLGLGA